MPDPLPAMCPQCGRRPDEVNHKTLATWKAEPHQLWPYCIARWRRTRSTPVAGRCGACGRHTDALSAGVCGNCKANGVEAPTLF